MNQIEGIDSVISLCMRSKFSKALRKCESLIARQQANPALVELKGDILISLKRFPEARKILEALQSPNNAGVIASIGMSYFCEGEYQRAIDYCREALSISKQCLKAWTFLFDALSGMGRKEEADKELANAFAAYTAKNNYERAMLFYLRSQRELEQGFNAKARNTILEAIQENRHEMFLSALQRLNPPATKASKWWLLTVSGDGSSFAQHGGNSDYTGTFEVIADDLDEAVKYIAEVEQRIPAESIRVDEAAKRKLKDLRCNKGLVAVRFSISCETRPLGKLEPEEVAALAANRLH